jgi:predicted metal-dependent peptidase
VSNDVVTFVIVHEACHIMLKHGMRLQGRDCRLANIAMDFAINIMLKKAGFSIWEFAYLDKYQGKSVDFKGLSFEQIYPILEEMDKEAKKNGRNGEAGNYQGGMSNDVIEPENLDPREIAEIERQIQQRVAQAASLARGQGQFSSDIERLVDGVLNPRLPWQTILQEYATRVIREDESWSRRDRRHQDVYLPGQFGVKVGEINVVVDTSGSISSNDLNQIAAEIGEIAEAVKPERIRVVYVDTAVAGEQLFEEGETVELKPRGGGGTNMRVGLKHIEQYNPIVVIMITDGDSPWPIEEPPYPLVIVCTTNREIPVGKIVRFNM